MEKLPLQEKLNTIQQEVEILLNESNPFKVSIAAIGQIPFPPLNPLLRVKYIRLCIGTPSFTNPNGYTENYLSSNWYEENLYENLCCCRQDGIEVSIHSIFDDQDNITHQIIFIS